MKYLKPILLVFALISLTACAVTDIATRKLAALTGGTEPGIYFAGVADLKLFPKPRFSKEYIAKVPLNAKLIRYKVERGFAHVKIASTGQTGWVNNAHLIWKKAGSQEITPGKGASKKSGPKEDLAKKSPPDENLIEAPSQPNPEIEGDSASSFDAF